MPSLRKKVSTYFRQLSFHNEPSRQKRNNVNENAFVTKYLQGQISLRDGPQILCGKTPEDVPCHQLHDYKKGHESIVACSTGPGGGLTTVKRTEKYLSIPEEDEPIDFIDTPQSEEKVSPNTKSNKSPKPGQPVDNTKMIIKVAGQEYFVQNETRKPRRNSSIKIDKTKTVRGNCTNANETVEKHGKKIRHRPKNDTSRNKETGKLIERPSRGKLPDEWKRKTEMSFGISDSLYDMNLVTKSKNGNPVADCFGIISRTDSMILAVADGVNWGEKACIAAKSAVHGCLHYLNKTIFNDVKLFDKTVSEPCTTSITNTREVFVCLLRAFNCAHDLILENKGMLTTLTAVVVLPLESEEFACCVCNVGDSLAYVYSQLYGLRELTKGSHDVHSNRDMRDALGALGPVEGINPELSNLTLAYTVLKKGDIVMVASDGLTDNFDPNVCKYTVSSKTPPESVKPIGGPVKNAAKTDDELMENPLIAHFIQQNSIESEAQASTSRTSRTFLRSRTTLDNATFKQAKIARNDEGIPYVTPLQRYELQLLLIEDILKRGISGNESASCKTAKKCCENLLNYTFSITAAKRRTLEDIDMYFDTRDGVAVEISAMEKKTRRKKWLERVANLPGKLDHVTIVAGNVANVPCV